MGHAEAVSSTYLSREKATLLACINEPCWLHASLLCMLAHQQHKPTATLCAGLLRLHAADNPCPCPGQPGLHCATRWSATWSVWELGHSRMLANCLCGTADVPPADTAQQASDAGQQPWQPGPICMHAACTGPASWHSKLMTQASSPAWAVRPRLQAQLCLCCTATLPLHPLQ